MSNAYSDLPYRRGVGVMVLNAQGHVFVARRIDMVSEAWQLPQGGIDKGEDPERAAYRELEEETGIKPNQVTLLARSRGWLRYDLPDELIPMLWKGKYRGQEQQWFVMRLTANEDVINIATEQPEFSKWQWVELPKIVDMIVTFKQPLYRQLVDEFGHLATPIDTSEAV
jgi:putative (di)nucleoside polyphosphate hydrolase